MSLGERPSGTPRLGTAVTAHPPEQLDRRPERRDAVQVSKPWIESEFASLRCFALNGTDHRSHAQQGEAIDSYMRWRNARAGPKRDFALGSVTRTWTDYKINVA